MPLRAEGVKCTALEINLLRALLNEKLGTSESDDDIMLDRVIEFPGKTTGSEQCLSAGNGGASTLGSCPLCRRLAVLCNMSFLYLCTAAVVANFIFGILRSG